MSGDPPTGPDLRARLLASSPGDYGLAPTPELPQVWAALMEMPVSGAVVSLIAVADGTTSLYFSTGGGILGGHAYEAVRDANRRLLVVAEKLLRGFLVRDVPAAVMPGAISFALLTYEGLRVGRDTEERLKTKASPLWPMYVLGHGVIAALRASSGGAVGG